MNLAGLIDHTILKPDASKSEIERVCGEAVEYGFASVCVNGCNVEYACSMLKGSSVKVACVVGFPLGAMHVSSKAFEARTAMESGAGEIDMVMNIGAFKDGDYDMVLEDIKSVVEAAKDATVKVIIETCLLSREEIAKASKLVKDSGAAFVKTSTGFSRSGANEEDIALIRGAVGPDFGIKASGGIRTYEDAIRMVEAGATRIGASLSVDIVKGGEGK